MTIPFQRGSLNGLYTPEKHTYELEIGDAWIAVPSVTKILEKTVVIPFGAGAWWGYRIGIDAYHELSRIGVLIESQEEAYEKAKATGIHPNAKRDKAADRGTDIHKALEDYGKTGKLLNPSEFPEQDRQMIRDLANWITENDPEFLEQEVRTGSVEWEYAGTFDARIKFGKGEYRGKTCLCDLKTTTRVSPEKMFPQLEAYERAEQECGINESDLRLIVHLPPTGGWTMVRSVDTFEDFRVLLAQYRSQEARTRRLKREKKRVAA